MKKLVFIISLLIPVMSFAYNVESSNAIETYQELCAKEEDPIKRQSYCHMLDHADSFSDMSEVNKDVVTV